MTTNTDPDDIDVIIPANDDAIRAVKLITAKLADAIIEGRQGEDAAAVEAEFAASEAQADSIEEIVEVVEGDKRLIHINSNYLGGRGLARLSYF